MHLHNNKIGPYLQLDAVTFPQGRIECHLHINTCICVCTYVCNDTLVPIFS